MSMTAISLLLPFTRIDKKRRRKEQEVEDKLLLARTKMREQKLKNLDKLTEQTPHMVLEIRKEIINEILLVSKIESNRAKSIIDRKLHKRDIERKTKIG